MHRTTVLLTFVIYILLAACGGASQGQVPTLPPQPAVATEPHAAETAQLLAATETAVIPSLSGPTPLPEDTTVEMRSNDQVALSEAQAAFPFRVPALSVTGFEQDGRASLWVFDVKSEAGETLGTYHMAIVDWFRMSNNGEVSRISLQAGEQYSHAYLLSASGEENIIVTSLGEFPAAVIDGQWEHDGETQGERRTLTLVWFENGVQYMLTIPKGVIDSEELGMMLLPPND